MRMRKGHGSVVLDKPTGVWYLRWRDAEGRRRVHHIGTLQQYGTKEQAATSQEYFEGRAKMHTRLQPKTERITVATLVKRYLDPTEDRLPRHFSTRSDYERILNSRVLPIWGEQAISELRPEPVQKWLKSLPLAPKTKANIKGLLRVLLEAAQFWGYLDLERNPMDLVKIRDCTIRLKEPQILTAEEFNQLLAQIHDEPLRTMVMFDMCLGLRFSELIALKWSDFDWTNLRVSIRRGAVRQRVGEVKTGRSRKPLPMDPELAELMLGWYRETAFAGPDDWVWASPHRDGRQPYAYSKLVKALAAASKRAGLGQIGWHTMRHSYRSWLDETGAPLTVQQNLMRHADIRTTMNIYGDAIPDTLRAAHGKVVRMALRESQPRLAIGQ